jgi:hypothetical protein
MQGARTNKPLDDRLVKILPLMARMHGNIADEKGWPKSGRGPAARKRPVAQPGADGAACEIAGK